MLIPIDARVGFTSVSLGLIYAIKQKNMRFSVFQPIAPQSYYGKDNQDVITRIVCNKYHIPYTKPLCINYVESLLAANKQDILMEEIISNYYYNKKEAALILVIGLKPTLQYQFIYTLNYQIAKMLDAEIILVLSLREYLPDKLQQLIKLAFVKLGGNQNITGIIINKLNAPILTYCHANIDMNELFHNSLNTSIHHIDIQSLSKNSPLPVIGAIPWNIDLINIRVSDIASYLKATIINQGNIQARSIKSVTFCTCNLANIIKYFQPDSMLVTSVDRNEVIVAICLAVMNGVEIGALLLTSSSYELDQHIYQICKKTFQTGLPVFAIQQNILQTMLILQQFRPEIPIDNSRQLENLQNYMASYINHTWIESITTQRTERGMLFSPPAFRYHITELARQANKRIVLPEGDEPRTIKAASLCAKRGIARCVLLGNPSNIQQIAILNSIELGQGIEIIEPIIARDKYVKRLVQLRYHKGMTEDIAYQQLKDNVVLGTLMLEQDEVDGLVSGAMHTTANTIRPPLQLIKTAPGHTLVSSVFFMLLPEQVLVYGDCAININPTAQQLAEIAIQSADSAATLGIEPKVAMISYSTGDSGVGKDVEKVRQATYLAQEKRPDLIIDGPLQYDAAVMAEVALYKAPKSPVAGQATVFIFPDLNTGNTTYKAVQRSAKLISIGPILQGLRKPINDLSRGALVEDIIYTIALTAIQSK